MGAILAAPAVLANPAGGNVVGGAATIVASGSQLDIHQASQRAVIDWSSFDIAAGETTRFHQPGAGAIALNRVVNSNQVSAINGNLVANGRVVIVNPNGVLIGSGANINAASFAATSADIADDKFMQGGTLDFDRAGRADAVVENRGHITVAQEGLAALVAPTVRNSGVIEGRLAKVQLAAADTFAVDFYGDGLIAFAVDTPEGGALRKLAVGNTGALVADGGQVLMTAAAASDVVDTAINTSGLVQARGLESRGGRIVLTGEGADLTVAGRVDASADAGNGGSVKIGGDFQGTGDLARADTVAVAPDAVVTANAVTNGDGGEIIVWSEKTTRAQGKFFARGGSQGGDGGLVETSSAGVLDVDGATVNTLAPKGKVGTWLLDPTNINVKSSGVAYTPLPVAGTSDIDVATINAALSNVVLQASNTINILANINIAAQGVGFTAIAGTAGSGVAGLTAGTGSINVTNQYIRTNGGAVTLTSGDTIQVQNADIFTRGGNIAFVSGDVTVGNSALATRGGSVSITAIDVPGNATNGGIQTNLLTIDTSSPLSVGIGGISLVENGSAIATGAYGNPQNKFVQNAKGGAIVINGKDISGNGVCFAAAGAGCGVDDPMPATAITITADSLLKTYGSADPSLTYSYSGALQAGDGFVGNLIRALGENAGSYLISQGTLSLSGAGNYTVTYVPAYLTINPYVLSVAAHAVDKVYGAADPALAYSYGALQNGDTDGVFTGGLTRAAGENVGSYAIGVGNLSAGGNYTLDYTADNLSITPYLLSVAANGQSKVYGAADPALTYSHGALQNGDTDGVFSGGLSRAAGENVGDYAIGAGTLSAGGNYTLDYTADNLSITPYLLSVAANGQSKIYGAADPALTYSHGALRNGDTAGIFSGGLIRAAGEGAGSYLIGQGTLSAGGNYMLDYTGSTLEISVPDTRVQNVRFDVTGRPVLSLAGKAIVENLAFEGYDMRGVNTDVSLGGGAANPAALNRLSPASGAVSPADLAAMEPASGGERTQTGNEDESGLGCANSFLNNAPCGTEGLAL